MSDYTSPIQASNYGGGRIRDQVHGDIVLPKKFMAIVDSPEFQRLRSVKQLATAQYAFPGAMHTRFAHSIGTFHVMQQILTHFENYFSALGYPQLIDQEEKDLILAASLLHDLGHTPFSHALEDAMSNAKKIPHEKWTVDLIRNKSGRLYHILTDGFGDNAPEKIADLILLQHDDMSDPFFSAAEIRLKNIFHSLISSQLDADRLDYIRRDSQATGLSYGLIDIDRLISGFRIGILDDGKAVVCVAEDNLADVEGYLYARYQMYRNVYLKPFKMLTEELLRKIIHHVYELYDNDKLKISDLPKGFKAALQKAVMSSEDFLSLDDYVILGAIKSWAKLKDPETEVLSRLCQNFLMRTGYQRYRFADVSKSTMDGFKQELVALLKKHMRESFLKKYENRSDSEWIQKFPFLVLKVEHPQLYKKNKDNIYILENSGRLVEISDCSNLVRAFLPGQGPTQGNTGGAVSAVYFSEDTLDCYLRQEMIFGELDSEKITQIKRKVEAMFNSREARNSIEIEKKYHVPTTAPVWPEVQEKLRSFLEEEGYTVTVKGNPEGEAQTDYYYDTADEQMYQEHISLRLRVKGGKTEITCKRPVEGSRSCGGRGQMERYEYAAKLKDVETDDLQEVAKCEEGSAFFHQHVADIAKLTELEKTIIVENTRMRYIVSKTVNAPGCEEIKEIYELAFDSVRYINCQNLRESEERQIEIELKSDPVMRLNMQFLTDKLERKFEGWKLTAMTDSKYERAKRFTAK